MALAVRWPFTMIGIGRIGCVLMEIDGRGLSKGLICILLKTFLGRILFRDLIVLSLRLRRLSFMALILFCEVNGNMVV